MPEQTAEISFVPPPGRAPDAVVFSSSETIPLGVNNTLLRKAAYGFSLIGLTFNGLSGIRNKNVLRTAAGFGAATMNLVSLGVKEQNQPLPDKPLSGQVAESLFKPQDNALFFNRSWSLVANALTFLSGMQSGSNKEALRGAWSVATGGIEVAGLSNQDRREKRAEARLHGEQVSAEDERTFTEEVLENRWISLGSSGVRAALMVAEGLERKHGMLDKNQLVSGILYCMSVLSLVGDNFLVEEQIRETDAQKGRLR